MALPYSDVYTTDAYMKDLIRRLELDVKYSAEALSAKYDDVLALTSFVRDVLSS